MLPNKTHEPKQKEKASGNLPHARFYFHAQFMTAASCFVAFWVDGSSLLAEGKPLFCHEQTDVACVCRPHFHASQESSCICRHWQKLLAVHCSSELHTVWNIHSHPSSQNHQSVATHAVPPGLK